MRPRPTIFKWRQSEPTLILCAVRWYLRYSLSLRDIEELLEERGLGADHTTVWRWVQRYAPELEQRMRRHLKPTNRSWRGGPSARPSCDRHLSPVPPEVPRYFRAIESNESTNGPQKGSEPALSGAIKDCRLGRIQGISSLTVRSPP